MVEVIGFGASPRRGGNTDRLMKRALKGVKAAGVRNEGFQLRDYAIGGCVGCERCRKDGICTRLMDGMQILYPKIQKAHGLILASPTHNYNVTSWMKAFIDRLYPYYIFTDDRPRGYTSRLAGQGRKAVVMAVCEQTDPRDMGFTLEAMRRPLEALGYEVIGELPVYGIFDLGAVAAHAGIMDRAEALGRTLSEALLAGRP